MEETRALRGLNELDEATCWARLNERRVGRLVVNVGHQPDIFPVNYVVDDAQIVIRTAEGTKLAAALMGMKVAFEIDEIDEDNHVGWSVVVHGEAVEARTLPAVMHDRDLALEPWARGDKTRYIRITPTRVTGRVLEPIDESEEDAS